jgi:hypothetical protein
MQFQTTPGTQYQNSPPQDMINGLGNAVQGRIKSLLAKSLPACAFLGGKLIDGLVDASI